jgi:glycosyltransferase involved in cell wall biosynthesis
MLELPGLRGLARHRLRVIPNGIPSRSARALDLAAESGRIPDLPVTHVEFLRARPTLVAIGRLSAEKGFDLLLEAFSRALPACGAPHQLLIVGDGPERAALGQRIAHLKLRERVRLAGYLPGADRLLQQAAGFVMSSRTEGMPVVLLEAMQWPVPILATAVGAIPELMPAGRGVLVPPADVAALTDGLVALMSSAALPACPPSVPEHSEDGSARMAQAYLQAYGSIALERQLAEAER